MGYVACLGQIPEETAHVLLTKSRECEWVKKEARLNFFFTTWKIQIIEKV